MLLLPCFGRNKDIRVIVPGAARRYAPLADGSSTCDGSTSSVRGRVRSPHISGGRPAAGSQRADSRFIAQAWTDRRTDHSIA